LRFPSTCGYANCTRPTAAPDHAETLNGLNNLATTYTALGQHTEALSLRVDTLARRTATLGSDNPDTLVSMNNLANSYAALGQHPKAFHLRFETLAHRQRAAG
jgi:ABC-type transporter Mla subunit MlaD